MQSLGFPEVTQVEGEIAALKAARVQKLELCGMELAPLSQEIPLARASQLPALTRTRDELNVAQLEMRAL
ncbi:MAG: hypothetical protein JOZ13_10050 [Alphaproteobacteria bacterium]|nr:hypothetical protein [Alphaproteobacteria bacterium]